MEFLWLIIGFIIGLLVAWFYLDARYKRQSAEREAELVDNIRQAEAALEREKDAHNTTKQRISELETQHTLAREQTASLTAELKKSEEDLERAKAAGGENRDMQAQLQQRDADIKRLETDLAECRAKAARAASAPAAAPGAGATPSYATSSPASSAPVSGSAGEGGSATAPAYAAASPASGEADDLTKIKGIGNVLKGKLNRLGIMTFRQIAEFTEADIERVNAELDFPGRIERERWVEQARDLVRQ